MQLKDLAPPHHSDQSLRKAFLDGVKAAFIVSQKNRLGQILCSSCGVACDTVGEAVAKLRLRHVFEDRPDDGYDPYLGWRNDDPNRLLLWCIRCAGSDAQDPMRRQFS